MLQLQQRALGQTLLGPLIMHSLQQARLQPCVCHFHFKWSFSSVFSLKVRGRGRFNASLVDSRMVWWWRGVKHKGSTANAGDSQRDVKQGASWEGGTERLGPAFFSSASNSPLLFRCEQIQRIMHWCLVILRAYSMWQWYQGLPSAAWRASAICGVIRGHVRHPQGRCGTGARDTHPAAGVAGCSVGHLKWQQIPVLKQLTWAATLQMPAAPLDCNTGAQFTKMHILYLNTIEQSSWDTNYRSKWWLCLSLFPGKIFQLGQLRPGLVTACKTFLLGFQQWAWLPSDISEHFFLSWGILWWSKPPCEGMNSNPFKDTTLLFSEMLSAVSFLKENSQNYDMIYSLLLFLDVLFKQIPEHILPLEVFLLDGIIFTI